ncbi:porin family protein [Hymenobacter rubripertinctus]|uniref:PorT family protein n=1 Tax=Hymenobacter rubripertinctus TaxID=2029981 RepID=A0A418QYJ9_9BACT|nr:porin family protein [Hymenobacter rubripertinctus]RIY10250.1 PorT family protein [Hymenobacter rubripertinctus]
MKKSLLAAAALLATVAVTESKAQGVRFGLKAGGNLSNLSGDLTDEDRYENKFGFHGGAMLNIGLLDDGFLSVQPEVLFSQKGFKYATNEFAIGSNKFKYEGDRTYNYIDVPVLLKVNADGFYFEAGPQYSYLLKVKDDSKFSVNGTTATQRTGTQDLKNVNRNEIGYAAGLGYQTDAGLMIGIRYNGSFTDFAKDGYQDSDVRNARNQVFQASVGFLLPGR